MTPRARRSRVAYFTAVTLAITGAVARADTIPYALRTKPYSAAETTVRGDIRTVGMAGATTGLADTFIASVDNPSGLAITDDQGDDTFTTNNVHDGQIQGYANVMSANFVGLALSPYPWGFGAGYVSGYSEGQSYVIPGANNNQEVPLDVISRELQFSASRVFLRDRLSLGVTLRVGQAEEDVDLGRNPSTAAFHSYAVGTTLGAMWQLPDRWLIGLSYSSPMRYSVDAASVPPTILPGFFEPVYTPARVSMGLGWIPNRFFRTSFSATWIDSTSGTALLSDQSVSVGVVPVWEPRLGAAYTFADFKEFRGTVYGGSYLEFSRVTDQPNRLHGTTGIEMKPWIFTVGWGVDLAHQYENYLVSLSVDIFKVMAKLDIIPTPWHPPYTGFRHEIFQDSDVGLARPLVKDWRPKGPDMNPIDIGLNIPQRIGERVGEAKDKITDIVKSVTDSPSETEVEPAVPAKSKAKTKGGKKKAKAKLKPKPKPTPSPDGDEDTNP